LAAEKSFLFLIRYNIVEFQNIALLAFRLGFLEFEVLPRGILRCDANFDAIKSGDIGR
jgi:hypothetical protein